MRILLFGIRDVKAEAFTRPPFAVQARGMAVRMFADLASDRQSDVGVHPEDYALYELGEWDQADGVLYPRDGGPMSLGTGLSFQRGDEPPVRLAR